MVFGVFLPVVSIFFFLTGEMCKSMCCAVEWSVCDFEWRLLRTLTVLRRCGR